MNSFDLPTYAADKDTARSSIDAFSGKIKSRDCSRLWGTKLFRRCRYLAGGVVLAGLLAGAVDLGVVPAGLVVPPERGAGGEMPD